MDVLKLSLENNEFIFNDDWYLQISGTAMGKKFALNYANIFMAKWEEEALKKARKQPLVYFRFLDDIFIVWNHSEKDFWEFFEVLNTHSESIKLKAEIQSQKIHFVDATLFKGKRFQSKGLIDIKVYFKPTDSDQVLDKPSFHPKHTFSGILKSQIIRYDRISSDPQDLENACDILCKSLRERGYNKRYLRSIKNKTLQELDKSDSWKLAVSKNAEANFARPAISFKRQPKSRKEMKQLKSFKI